MPLKTRSLHQCAVNALPDKGKHVTGRQGKNKKATQLRHDDKAALHTRCKEYFFHLTAAQHI